MGRGALVARRPDARCDRRAARMAVLASWSLASQRQLAHWRDTRALFEHALAVDSTNAMAHASLGTLDEREGRYAEALAHYDAATRLSPDTWDAARRTRARAARARSRSRRRSLAGPAEQARAHGDAARSRSFPMQPKPDAASRPNTGVSASV
jgi:tetratricopeptide (TPR) repeat protein